MHSTVWNFRKTNVKQCTYDVVGCGCLNCCTKNQPQECLFLYDSHVDIYLFSYWKFHHIHLCSSLFCPMVPSRVFLKWEWKSQRVLDIFQTKPLVAMLHGAECGFRLICPHKGGKCLSCQISVLIGFVTWKRLFWPSDLTGAKAPGYTLVSILSGHQCFPSLRILFCSVIRKKRCM